jgi:cell division protein FtsB
MHRQIYQAYLSRPHALFRLFENSFGKETLHGPPDPDHQQQQIDDLSAHIARLEARVEKLQAEVSQLRGRKLPTRAQERRTRSALNEGLS